LRVLLGHNYYRSSAPSGEDAVFENERRLLEDAGAVVTAFIRRNDDLQERGPSSRLRIGLETTWSRSAYRELSEMIRKERPDIAHFHNTFPQISPSAYAACQKLRVPVVQTLHNYRLICAGALLHRDGHPCEDCVEGGALLGLLPGLRHRCYRGSLLATGALTLMLAANRALGSYSEGVDRYIALTKFAASRFKAGGLPADRFTVKPNFLPDPPQVGAGQGGYAVYVGRLSAEKGVLTLLRAWRSMGRFPLKLLGNGPLAQEMRRICDDEGLNVEFLGFRPREDVKRVVADAAVQIVPSEWYEGFPMAVLEAFACGTPVVATQIGSLDEIVQEGVTGAKFPVGDAAGLAAAVWRLTADGNRLVTMRHAAREAFDRSYTAERNIEQLLAIYRDVLAERRSRK
jgi:glycosyltransferase involved in cell wall biosynthesis